MTYTVNMRLAMSLHFELELFKWLLHLFRL